MILTCPSCGKKNRSPAERLADGLSVLPAGRILEVQYEEIVGDLAGQARRLVRRQPDTVTEVVGEAPPLVAAEKFGDDVLGRLPFPGPHVRGPALLRSALLHHAGQSRGRARDLRTLRLHRRRPHRAASLRNRQPHQYHGVAAVAPTWRFSLQIATTLRHS